MSFSLSRKSTVKVNEKDQKQKQGQDGSANAVAAAKRGFGMKQNPVLLAKTENYVDDVGLYQPKIFRADRHKYFDFIIENWKLKRRKPGRRDDTWIAEKIKEENDEVNYPPLYVKMFRVLRSNRWDHIYLDGFILFLLLCVLYFDGYAKQMVPILVEMQSTVMAVPLIIMLVSAALPCLGTAWFVHYGNDLVHYTAVQNFQHWGFACALTAQYVEYFHYSGQRRRHVACNLHPSRIMSNVTPLKDSLAALGRRVMYVVNVLRRRQHAVVEPQSDEEAGSERSDDGQHGADNNDPARALEFAAPVAPPPSAAHEHNPAAHKNINNIHDSGSEDGGSDEGRDNESLDTFERELRGPPVEMVEWTCLVCNTFNPSTPKIPTTRPEIDYSFGTHGVHYKRLYVHMIPRPHKPCCKKCFTPYDYEPPVGSAHIFPSNPNPHVAFNNYPPVVSLHFGLKDTPYERRKSAFLSFLHGINKSFDATPIENDWRLKKWAANMFPPIPRYMLLPGERYELGEIVECILQKNEFCRARIVSVRPNDNYDIRYDAGDELRFVPSSALRLGAEKGAFAYRVEILMVGLYIYFPLGLLLSVMSGSAAMLFVGPLVVGVALFAIRIDNFLQYVYNYGTAGMCVILRATAFFALPVFLLLIAGAVGLLGGADLASSAAGITALFALVFAFSLPLLYAIRPHYAALGLIVFVPASMGLVLLTMHFSSQGAGAVFPSIGIPLAPFLITSLFLKYLRGYLHAIWDVCLVIRPALPHSRQSLWLALYRRTRAAVAYYMP